jgi:hypothetical protein
MAAPPHLIQSRQVLLKSRLASPLGQVIRRSDRALRTSEARRLRLRRGQPRPECASAAPGTILGQRPLCAAPRVQHPPTAIIGQQTQGEATSPQDVQSQNRGGPTAAEQAQGAGGPLRRRSLQHKRRSRRRTASIGPERRPSAWTLSGVQRGSWDSVSDKTSARSHGWSARIVNSQTVRPVRRVLPPRGPCSERCRPSVY